MAKDFTIVIPARLESTRLPKKLLQKDTGKELIVHSLENLSALSDKIELVVVTDSEEIATVSKEHCDRVFMSPPECKSGSERIMTILDHIESDWILNVQADEPEVNVDDLQKLMDYCLKNSESESMATLGVPFENEKTYTNPNAVKVLVSHSHHALYFSRTAIPHNGKYHDEHLYHHLGVYAYKKSLLKKWNDLTPGVFEQTEKLEQLRALENGISIFVLGVSYAQKGIDTPEDYQAFTERKLNKTNGPN